MALDKFKFPIVQGPSLFELMLAHYDARPINLTESADRFVRFTIKGDYKDPAFREAVTSETEHRDKGDTHVYILGTQRRHFYDTVWRFRGIVRRQSCGPMGAYKIDSHTVAGHFDVKTRTGSITFFKIKAAA